MPAYYPQRFWFYFLRCHVVFGILKKSSDDSNGHTNLGSTHADNNLWSSLQCERVTEKFQSAEGSNRTKRRNILCHWLREPTVSSVLAWAWPLYPQFSGPQSSDSGCKLYQLVGGRSWDLSFYNQLSQFFMINCTNTHTYVYLICIVTRYDYYSYYLEL